MDLAMEIGDVDLAGLDAVVDAAQWKKPEGKAYLVAALAPDAHPLLSGCRRAFFLKIGPGGFIHPHTDSASKVFDTDLIVVSTNKQCRTYWQVENVTFSKHLELGKRYRMADRGVEHWAVNNGRADRVHLLIEYSR
jgi:hypothetical protein